MCCIDGLNPHREAVFHCKHHGEPVCVEGRTPQLLIDYPKADGTVWVPLMWELAILASQRACMRVVIRGLAAVLLEFPAHPAPVPDADSIPAQSELNKQKRHREGVVFVCWWRRRELNPRPQALYRQFYILSLAV